jgi:hypothetical protein
MSTGRAIAGARGSSNRQARRACVAIGRAIGAGRLNSTPSGLCSGFFELLDSRVGGRVLEALAWEGSRVESIRMGRARFGGRFGLTLGHMDEG